MKRTIEQIKEEITRIEKNIMDEQKQIEELRKEKCDAVQREIEKKYNIKSGDKIIISKMYRTPDGKLETKSVEKFYVGIMIKYSIVILKYADIKKDGSMSNVTRGDYLEKFSIKKAE